MKHILTIFVSLFFYTGLLIAQPTPPSDLEGSALRTWLKTNWYNSYHDQLGYDNAREQMYGYIDKQSDGQVYCVYTGFHQAGSYTTYLNPINCEHTVPQSWFGQDEPMRSDIFHLFPTHEDVNNARSNLDLAEIIDSQTDKWYIVNGSNTGLTILTSTPTSNIDLYSELNTNTNFEPREEHCGDAARAIFYFYTMYPTQAGSISDLADLETLYQWHLEDPVDSWEIQRNNRIENRQGNRNPYIDYPDIACRAWNLECISGIHDHSYNINITPNPAKDHIKIQYNSIQIIYVNFYSVTGQKINIYTAIHDSYSMSDIGSLSSGIYFIEIIDIKGNKILKKLIKE